MKHILVTGANGQLGNEMRVQAASQADCCCMFTDVGELDICDEEAVRAFFQTHQVDVLVNCAAYTAVDKAEDNAAMAARLNADAVEILARAAHEAHADFIQVSTDYVFDGTAHVPYQETCEPCPASVYGRTKLEGERRALAACPRTMIVRTAWLYSAFGNNFVKTMMRLGRERTELGVVADQIGTPTYARDLACAIFAAINHGVVPGIYHFTNEGVCSWYDFTKAIHHLAGIHTCHVRPLHTDEYPARAPRPAYSVLDKTKIKQTYGIEIRHWFDALHDMIEQYEPGN